MRWRALFSYWWACYTLGVGICGLACVVYFEVRPYWPMLRDTFGGWIAGR